MVKAAFLPLFLILLVSIASAHASVDYTLIEDKAFVELNLGEVSNFEYILPYDARTLESNSDFDLVDEKFSVLYSNDLQFSYIAESVIEKSSKRDFFILNNDFEEGIMLTLKLPEGGILDEGGLLVPSPDEMSTDGRTIILRWNNLTAQEVVVSYEPVRKTNLWIVLITLALLIVFLAQVISLKHKVKRVRKKKKVSVKKQKAKVKRDITRNLFGEEKKIIEYLLERKRRESWTKEIVRDLGISKVRLSRRLRSLQQKELVEKIPYGNENRIRLLKRK